MRVISKALTSFGIKITLLAGIGMAPLATSQANAQSQKPKATAGASDKNFSIQAGHPRLLASQQDIESLKKLVQESPDIQKWLEHLQGEVAKLMQKPPTSLETGEKFLWVSREVLDRIRLLVVVYKMTGDQKVKERIWKEAQAVMSLEDWDPSKFLAAAEISFALALAYDWLHDEWSSEERQAIRTAIIEKGLKPGMAAYDKDKRGWAYQANNWNLVCNGSLGMAALAIADEESQWSEDIFTRVKASLPIGIGAFAPDGGWGEGPTYWNYATEFAAYFLASLEISTGSDLGFSEKAPGFLQTAYYPIYFTGSSGTVFNYSDAQALKFPGAPQLFWWAKKLRNPAVAAFQLSAIQDPSPMDFIWGAHWKARPDAAVQHNLPLDRYYRGETELVAMREQWHEPNASSVAVKAGVNSTVVTTHRHLDLGTFVFDALGVRWAEELGLENYSSPRYFYPDGRWKYYRARAEGHNTIVLNPTAAPDQDVEGVAKIVQFRSLPSAALTVVDLAKAYPDAQSVQRGIALVGNRKNLLIQDELILKNKAPIWWFMHSRADIKLAPDGKSATLSQEGRTLNARILSPATAVFTVMDAVPLTSSPRPESQTPNPKMKKLAVQLNDSRARIAVLLSPVFEGNDTPDPALKPLQQW